MFLFLFMQKYTGFFKSSFMGHFCYFQFLSLSLQSQTNRLGGGMVDTRDLKSLGPQGLYGFESRPRHRNRSQTADDFLLGLL